MKPVIQGARHDVEMNMIDLELAFSKERHVMLARVDAGSDRAKQSLLRESYKLEYRLKFLTREFPWFLDMPMWDD